MSLSGARSGGDEVTLYLSRNQRGIIPVPQELQGIIPENLWNSRIQVATATASRYSKPLFERIWLLIALISVIVLPVALVPIIANKLYTEDREKDGYFFGVARGIGFALFVGTGLVFFVPVFVWKLSGRIQVMRLLKHWTAEDRVMLDQTKFVPTWKIKSPGVFRDSIVLIISKPPATYTSPFHPAAQTPNYVLGAPQQPEAVFHNISLKNEGDNPFADFDEKIPVRGDARFFLEQSNWETAHLISRHCACVYYQDWHRTKRPKAANEGGGILPAVSQAIAPLKSVDASPAAPSSNFSSPRNTLSSNTGVIVAVSDAAEPQPNVLLQTNAPPPAAPPSSTALPFDEEAKLVYGVILSLRNMAKKLSGRDELFTHYRTSTYKVHLYETISGYKFVMFSDPNADSLRFAMRQIYVGPFIEYVVRNPLVELDSKDRGIDNEYFRAGVDRLIRGLSVFSS